MAQSEGPQQSLIEKTSLELRLEGGVELHLVENIPGKEDTLWSKGLGNRAQYTQMIGQDSPS